MLRKTLDDDLKSFFSRREEVPADVKIQISEKLRVCRKDESNSWAVVMVICSIICMAVFAGTAWMFFGQAALWILAGIYYFMASGAAVSVLLLNRRVSV